MYICFAFYWFDLEKPAIDRLLDYLSYQESQKAAIDILIQEYLERVNSPSVHFYTTKYEEENKSIENQTTPRTVLYNGNIASIFPTPNTSSNDVSYDPNYEFRNSASTPLLPLVLFFNLTKTQTFSFLLDLKGH